MRLLPFLLALLLPLAAPAQAQFAGVWEVVEYDPLMPENDFFGQFRYRMEVHEENGLYRIVAPRTGAEFGPAPLTGGRLVAEGEEPNRGAATLDIVVRNGRFEGAIAFATMRRRIVGELDPGQRAGALARQRDSAREQAESARATAEAAQTQQAALERRLAAAEARLVALEREAAAERAARERAEQALAESRRRVAELEVRANRPAPPAAPPPPPPPLIPARPAIEPAQPATDVSTRCYQLAVLPQLPSEEALEVCRAAVRSRDGALDHYHLGVALSRLGRHQEAIYAWREAAARWTR